ncbi:hypothetical protein [Haloarcula nitratireducens]|uniref:Uncharacterized protein n=1 Tax=Haloarcula nitratireducens TaxID=2487749 RepID=A0AAW4PHE7_9EURY|nr:hypothetical protein [Halomicroarcula nitratireducens]MBX0297361.1 hypothetical protein [Halomicroarcula nitratireducens]
MKRKHTARFLGFLVIGVLMGVFENLLAIWLTTDESFTLEVVIIVVLVAIPFAAAAELVIDFFGRRVFDDCLCWLSLSNCGFDSHPCSCPIFATVSTSSSPRSVIRSTIISCRDAAGATVSTTWRTWSVLING